MRHLFMLALLPITGLLHAQTYAHRANSGAILEPQGVIMHGAGQDPTSFAAYWSAMPIGRQPVVCMYYISLDTLSANWADPLKAQILSYPGNLIIPQIGLSMTNGASDHYEAQVAAGAYDTEIGYLIAGLRQLANPVYLRIGYEFNGVSWNGYVPGPYAQAFIHVTNLLRAAPDLEVATVWDAEVPDGATDFTDYYPGDSYVDWFGVNVFSADGFTSPALPAFTSLASSHNKPVMMGETTPKGVGAQAGAASWTGWFVPFFDFLATTPHLKQFNYIDWNWDYWATEANQPGWATWGDARLELSTATYVRDRYIPQVADPLFFNSTIDESSFRRLLGYKDTTPPPMVSGLKVSSAPGGAALTWNPVTDPSGIARYYLYRNNTLLDYALSPPYTDSSVGLGTSTYTIAAMDRAGNVGAPPQAQSINLTQIQRIQNGDFENGLTDWQFNSYATGAAGTAVVDTSNPIDGKASVLINVTQSTGTNWNLQLLQTFQMTAGLTYKISFKARSSAPVSLPFVIQEAVSPSTIYFDAANFSVTSAAASYSYSFIATTSQPVVIGFYVDNIGNASLWLDDISVVESGAKPPNLLASGVQNGASYQPGVVPGSWLVLKGANLATVAQDSWANAIINGALPISLDGVSVSIGGHPAYIYFISPGQLNVIAPNLSPGPATLTVSTPNGTSFPVTVNVAAQAPAFFLWPENQAVATQLDGSFVAKPGTFVGATTAAAHPGDVLVLWGTGFGATTPPVPEGIVVPSGPQHNCSPATVTLGGKQVKVYGCALSGSVGNYQVAIQVPTPLKDGDYALQVTVNGAVSTEDVILSVSN